jgi:peptide/nickel transport system permease protein
VKVMGFSRALQKGHGRTGALVLALMGFVAIFADSIAADAPFLIVSSRGVYVLPAITQPARFGPRSAKLAPPHLESGEYAVWPLWRAGPATSKAVPFAYPSLAHPLGTDAFGRDVLARLVHGTRTTLLLGAGVAGLSLLLGCLLGGGAAMYGGILDSLVQRFVEALCVFPAVVLVALARSFERQPSFVTLGAVLVLARCAEMTKVVRILVVRALAQDWALAARALGVSRLRLALVHIGPHVITPILVSATFSIGAVVLTEAALSFLGLGVPVGTASWGEMLGEIRWGAGPLVLVPPAIALAAAVLGAHLLARSVGHIPETA